jgi:hypothetical protein
MMITLLNGTVVDTADIVFNTSDYSFTLSNAGGTQDVTLQITEADKEANWPNWDLTTWNNIYYTNYLYPQTHGGAAAPAVGSTSTLTNFMTQIETDPLAAPLQSADTLVGNTVKTLIGSSAVQTIVIFGALALIGYLILAPKIRAASR